MKKAYFLLLLSILTLSIRAQFIENKLNLGIGISAPFPLNKKLVETDGFHYPSLWRNYGPGIGGVFHGSFKAKDKWWIEASFQYTYYPTWENADETFILLQPQSTTNTYTLGALYLPLTYETYNSNMQLGMHASLVLFEHSLEWQELLNTGIIDEPMVSNFQRNAGFEVGVTFLREKDNWQGSRVDLTYGYVRQDNYFYLDQGYHSLSLSVIYYLKFIKNRMYQYE